MADFAKMSEVGPGFTNVQVDATDHTRLGYNPETAAINVQMRHFDSKTRTQLIQLYSIKESELSFQPGEKSAIEALFIQKAGMEIQAFQRLLQYGEI